MCRSVQKDGLGVFVLNFDVTSEEDTDKGITLIERNRAG